MKIIYYINQFFGQIGGEEHADYPLQVSETNIGPAMVMNSSLPEDIQVVATIICGDNYALEKEAEFTEKMEEALDKYKPDLLISGPAFNAGRYGMACGMASKVAYEKGIEAISGMYEENPAVEIYHKYAFIFATQNTAKGMRAAVKQMADFVKRYAAGENIYSPSREGFFERGIRKYIDTGRSGAARAIDMAVAKAAGESWKTELNMPNFSHVPASAPIADLSKAKIALLTTCGPVPIGNPDHLEAHTCSKWETYRPEDFGGEDMPATEIAHGGYTPVYGTNNGNRVVPVDAMLELEKEGYIGSFYREVFVTVGNSMSVTRAEEFGEGIALTLKERGIEGAILTSA